MQTRTVPEAPAAEHPPVAKDTQSLATLAERLTTTTTGAAAMALARHVGHTWRKRTRRRFGREVAKGIDIIANSVTLQGVGGIAESIERSAEGLELWAFLRGFEAGRKSGADEAGEAAAQGQLAAMRAAAARQHSDGAVNRAEFWRQRFAALAGLPTTTTWEELRDLVANDGGAS